MKTVLLILVAIIGFGISTNAQTTGSCKVEGIPGAYVTAEAEIIEQGGIFVKATAYGIEKGSVECIVKYTNANGNPQQTSGLISLSKDRNGNVVGIMRKNSLGAKKITDTKVFSAVCIIR